MKNSSKKNSGKNSNQYKKDSDFHSKNSNYLKKNSRFPNNPEKNKSLKNLNERDKAKSNYSYLKRKNSITKSDMDFSNKAHDLYQEHSNKRR